MKHVFLTRAAALLLACVLAFAFVGCGKGTVDSTASSDAEQTTAGTTAEWTHAGEGNSAFPFIVTFADGTKQNYIVYYTDEDSVGTALLDAGLIEGEQGAYGLYVKSVCGVVADYDVDATYWALYVDGEMSQVGVDGVKCADVTDVEFRVEK